MIVRCWGARGSIPVSGTEYLKYGGDTTCIELRTKDDEVIIVDAGSGIRRLGNKMLKEGRRNFSLIFTHAHWDHLIGFPFFKPLYFSDTRINLYGCSFAQKSIKEIISKPMTPPYFPIQFDDIKAVIKADEACRRSFFIGSVEVTPIPLSHPNQGMGYKFKEDGKVFVFLTDNELTYKHHGGLAYEDYVQCAKDADLLMHDAEFTQEEYKRTKTWGHSVYSDALRLALDARVKQFGLFHHNQDRSDAAVDKIVNDCENVIRSKGSNTKCFAVTQASRKGTVLT